eukprot:146483-Chlamydomonas_euryale.AAC.1
MPGVRGVQRGMCVRGRVGGGVRAVLVGGAGVCFRGFVGVWALVLEGAGVTSARIASRPCAS